MQSQCYICPWCFNDHTNDHCRTEDVEERVTGLLDVLEIAYWEMCHHSGELRPGTNREWCHDCSSWVYPSDKADLELIKKELGSRVE